MAASISAPKTTKVKPARQSAKDKARSPSIGHNTEPLTEEEQSALQTHHELKIRAQLRKAATAKAAHDLEKTEVNGLFKKAGADLKITRREFEDMLAKRDMTESEFLAAEGKRATLYRRAGLPVAQADLFPETIDTVTEQSIAYKDGFRAGRRADDPIAPKTISAVVRADWEHGYADGQAKNVMELGIAETVLARMAVKPAGADDAEPEVEVEDLEDTIKKQARKLKASGFMDLEPDAQTH